MQSLRTGQIFKRVCRQADLRRNILEEILHRTTAGLIEVADAIIHILENVGKLVTLNTDRAGSKGKTLEIFECRVRNLGALRNVIDGTKSAPQCNSETRERASSRRGCCDECRLDSGPKLAGLSLRPFCAVFKLGGVQAKIDA
ncbi:hypothetical protein [Agrobacterium pusense]|uniref:hypothetical protein n=1 Tax=Agrobacterium pusense TaxID=648995 RepID=UPI00244B8D39|nr:hypothetical protein [Agrobacterium pusense]MDH0873666.1 hypothetical protein [Agrobacterium pusense]